MTCISALVGGGHIWVGGTQGLLIHSADHGETWEQLPVITPSSVEMPINAQPTSPPAKTSLRRHESEESEIIRVAVERPPSDAQEPLANPAAGMQQRPMNQAAPPSNPAQTQPSAAPLYQPQFTPPPISLPRSASLISNHLVDLQFVTASVGYAVTKAGEILSTSDGGRKWRRS